MAELNAKEIADTICEGIKKGMEDAKNTLEKAEKYRWHDLRKNPEDLPKEDSIVLVCYKFWDSHNSYKVACFHNSENDICFYPDGNSRIELSMVIGWKCIEPFNI